MVVTARMVVPTVFVASGGTASIADVGFVALVVVGAGAVVPHPARPIRPSRISASIDGREFNFFLAAMMCFYFRSYSSFSL